MRRLTLVVVSVTALATVVLGQAASASVAPLGVRGATAGPPGGGKGGGGQGATGGWAQGRQGSGNGRFNQNLNGVYSPTFMWGQQLTGITVGGRINTQDTTCGFGAQNCKIAQNMWSAAQGW